MQKLREKEIEREENSQFLKIIKKIMIYYNVFDFKMALDDVKTLLSPEPREG